MSNNLTKIYHGVPIIARDAEVLEELEGGIIPPISKDECIVESVLLDNSKRMGNRDL